MRVEHGGEEGSVAAEVTAGCPRSRGCLGKRWPYQSPLLDYPEGILADSGNHEAVFESGVRHAFTGLENSEKRNSRINAARQEAGPGLLLGDAWSAIFSRAVLSRGCFTRPGALAATLDQRCGGVPVCPCAVRPSTAASPMRVAASEGSERCPSLHCRALCLLATQFAAAQREHCEACPAADRSQLIMAGIWLHTRSLSPIWLAARAAMAPATRSPHQFRALERL
jgi:hypothetical protein